jgi:hypothetical protein
MRVFCQHDEDWTMRTPVSPGLHNNALKLTSAAGFALTALAA